MYLPPHKVISINVGAPMQLYWTLGNTFLCEMYFIPSSLGSSGYKVAVISLGGASPHFWPKCLYFRIFTTNLNLNHLNHRKAKKYQKSYITAIYRAIFQNGSYFQNFVFLLISLKVLRTLWRKEVRWIHLIETVI